MVENMQDAIGSTPHAWIKKECNSPAAAEWDRALSCSEKNALVALPKFQVFNSTSPVPAQSTTHIVKYCTHIVMRACISMTRIGGGEECRARSPKTSSEGDLCDDLPLDRRASG